MTKGRRKWWHRLLESGAQCTPSAMPRIWLSGSQLGASEPALPASKVGGPRRSGKQVASCEFGGSFRRAVDDVSQIREHVRRSLQTHDRTAFSSPPELCVKPVRKPEWTVADFLEKQRGGALPRWRAQSLRSGMVVQEPSLLVLSQKGRAMQEMLKSAAPPRGGRSTRPSSLSAVLRAHQSRDRAVQDLRTRGAGLPTARKQRVRIAGPDGVCTKAWPKERPNDMDRVEAAPPSLTLRVCGSTLSKLVTDKRLACLNACPSVALSSRSHDVNRRAFMFSKPKRVSTTRRKPKLRVFVREFPPRFHLRKVPFAHSTSEFQTILMPYPGTGVDWSAGHHDGNVRNSEVLWLALHCLDDSQETT